MAGGTIPVNVMGVCTAVLVLAQSVNSESDDRCSRTYESDSSSCAASCHTFNVGDTPASRVSSTSRKDPIPITRIPAKSVDGSNRKPISLFISVPRCIICPKGNIIVIRIYTGRAAHGIISIRTSPATSDHQERTWYGVWKDLWISIAVSALFAFWFVLETGVIVCGLALVGILIWKIAGGILTPCLLDALGLFLWVMSVVLYWYIMELLRSRGFMLEVALSHSDRLAARMYLAF